MPSESPSQLKNLPDQSLHSSISRISQFCYDLHNTIGFISALPSHFDMLTHSAVPPRIPSHSRPIPIGVSMLERYESVLERPLPIKCAKSEKFDSEDYAAGRKRDSISERHSHNRAYESHPNQDPYSNSPPPIPLHSRPISVLLTTPMGCGSFLGPRAPSPLNDSDSGLSSPETNGYFRNSDGLHQEANVGASNSNSDPLRYNSDSSRALDTTEPWSPDLMPQIKFKPFLELSFPSDTEDSDFNSSGNESTSEVHLDNLSYGSHASQDLSTPGSPILAGHIEFKPFLELSSPSDSENLDSDFNSSRSDGVSEVHSDNLSYESHASQNTYTTEPRSPLLTGQMELKPFIQISLPSDSEDSDSDFDPSGSDSTSEVHSDDLSYDSHASQDSQTEEVVPFPKSVLQKLDLNWSTSSALPAGSSKFTLESTPALSRDTDANMEEDLCKRIVTSILSRKSTEQPSPILTPKYKNQYEKTIADIQDLEKKKGFILSELKINVIQEGVEEVEELYINALKLSAMKYRRNSLHKDSDIDLDLLSDEKVKELYLKTLKDKGLQYRRKSIAKDLDCADDLLLDEEVEEFFRIQMTNMDLKYKRQRVAEVKDCNVDVLSDKQVEEIYHKCIADGGPEHRRKRVAGDYNVDWLSDEKIEELYNKITAESLLQYHREAVADDEDIFVDLLSNEEVEEKYKQMMERRCGRQKGFTKLKQNLC